MNQLFIVLISILFGVVAYQGMYLKSLTQDLAVVTESLGITVKILKKVNIKFKQIDEELKVYQMIEFIVTCPVCKKNIYKANVSNIKQNTDNTIQSKDWIPIPPFENPASHSCVECPNCHNHKQFIKEIEKIFFITKNS